MRGIGQHALVVGDFILEVRRPGRRPGPEYDGEVPGRNGWAVLSQDVAVVELQGSNSILHMGWTAWSPKGHVAIGVMANLYGGAAEAEGQPLHQNSGQTAGHQWGL